MTNQKISTCCDNIREAWYQRQMLVRADGSLVRQLKSICRRLCGGDKVAGTKLYKKLWRAKVDSPDLLALGANIVLLKHEIATQLALDEQERMLYSHVRSLPVWMEKLFLKLLWREWTGRGQEWVEPQRLAA